jgi:hypothetical protein
MLTLILTLTSEHYTTLTELHYDLRISLPVKITLLFGDYMSDAMTEYLYTYELRKGHLLDLSDEEMFSDHAECCWEYECALVFSCTPDSAKPSDPWLLTLTDGTEVWVDADHLWTVEGHDSDG